MPSWKKVITSGSDAALNSLDVTGAVTASFFKGDGSQLTGISGGSITVADDGSTQGSATYFNFGANITATVSSNTASLSATGGSSFPFTGSAIISGSLLIHSSGSTIFQASGSRGNLLTIADQVSTFGTVIESSAPVILAISGSLGDVARFYNDNLQITGVLNVNYNQNDPTIAHFKHNTGSYVEVNIQNLNSGTSASSDIILTNDIGTDTTFYTDLGINSSGFGGFIGGPNDGYLYHTGSHLYVGNITPGKNLYLFTATTSSSEIIISGSTGYIGINKDRPTVPLDVVGNTIISGSLVSTDNRFSKGATLANYDTGITNNQSYFVWRAPYRCRVVAVYGIRVGGSSTPINASRQGPSGYGLHLSANLSVTGSSVWQDGGAVQNTDYVAGDMLEIRISGSGASPNQAGVQVDFIRL